MASSPIHWCCRMWMPSALCSVVLLASTVTAQVILSAEPVVATTAGEAEDVRFSFSGAPWRDVISWLADEADLALHVGDLPTGSFTYTDPDSFTHQEAIDRVNLFLLPQGYTLVRSGKLLSVINLGDPRGMQQLDAIAELVTVEQLDEQNSYQVVKCIFPLGEIEAAEAVQELSVLKLMSTPELLTKTNQLMITDTAKKLKSVKAVLDAFQSSGMDNGTVVKSFALQHVDAEDILIVARPHMGLATGEMIGIDVSLSADLQGKNIFVTGVEDKVKLLEGLVTAIDQPQMRMSTDEGEMILQSHIVEGGNVETVYNVLQTLLAGKQVRLSMDETAGSVVALASPSVQAEIEQTVAQLKASEADFAVIQLKTVDPYFAVSLLEEMLDLAEVERRASAGMEAFTRHGNSRGLDILNSNINIDVPRIDADPVNRRLFVRAKRPQIEQIKKIVAELDNNGSVGSSDEIRILPLSGKEALRVLGTAIKFWREPNPVILFQSIDDPETEQTERVVSDTSPNIQLTSSPVSFSDVPPPQLLTTSKNSQASAIHCQITARGLLLQSDDTTALDQFEQHLRMIAGPTDSTPSPPIVFYLKFTKADDALRMLADLLEGGESAGFGVDGSLVNAYVDSSDSFFGSFVTSRDGTTTMTSGSMTVVADSRLNRLIAQGTANEIEQIEGYLKIIDKDNSITSIETYGTSRVIELFNTKASEVATAIRDAYAGRVNAASNPGQANQPGSPQGQAEAAAMRGEQENQQDPKKGAKKTATQPPRSLEPKMTIAVHEPSNSLIVTAPQQLFDEVEQLAKSIDSRNEQMIEVVTPANGAVFETVLQQLLLGEVRSAPGRPSPSSSPRPPVPQPAPSSSRSKGR